jgi:mRNA interferase MazF
MQVNRGEIWSVLWTGLAGKPRPALVIQSENYRSTDTDILALITTTENKQEDLRLFISANDKNGLSQDSYICLDKLMAIPLVNLGQCYGKVSPEIMSQIDQHLVKILGIQYDNVCQKVT